MKLSPRTSMELQETQQRVERENAMFLDAAKTLAGKLITEFSAYRIARQAGLETGGARADEVVARLIDQGYLERTACNSRQVRLTR
jgi:hypothetical protein